MSIRWICAFFFIFALIASTIGFALQDSFKVRILDNSPYLNLQPGSSEVRSQVFFRSDKTDQQQPLDYSELKISIANDLRTFMDYITDFEEPKKTIDPHNKFVTSHTKLELEDLNQMINQYLVHNIVRNKKFTRRLKLLKLSHAIVFSKKALQNVATLNMNPTNAGIFVSKMDKVFNEYNKRVNILENLDLDTLHGVLGSHLKQIANSVLEKGPSLLKKILSDFGLLNNSIFFQGSWETGLYPGKDFEILLNYTKIDTIGMSDEKTENSPEQILAAMEGNYFWAKNKFESEDPEFNPEDPESNPKAPEFNPEDPKFRLQLFSDLDKNIFHPRKSEGSDEQFDMSESNLNNKYLRVGHYAKANEKDIKDLSKYVVVDVVHLIRKVKGQPTESIYNLRDFREKNN